MSYAEYMRRKSAAATVILDTRKPTDSSMYTLKKRHMASTVFPVNGGDIGSMIEGSGRSGNSHQPLSYQKSTGRPKDSSDYTSYRGSQAIRNDAAYDRGRIEQTCGSGECVPRNPDFFTTGQRTASTVSTNASSFIKQKLACTNQLALMPHTSGQVGPPVFVDNTISLNGYSNCVQNETLRPKAIHDIKAEVPYPTHPPRPSQAGGQYAILGVPTTIPVQYKAGAPLRNIPYVEKHHGNDLNVNPKQAFVRYQGNGPAHNKINKPNFANVKP
jgi:hypothetical protein